MLIEVLDLGKVLERRGYWDPKRFPLVSAFAALPKKEQDAVVVTCKRVGFRFALEVIPMAVQEKELGRMTDSATKPIDAKEEV